MVALLVAQRRPDLVDRLVLIGQHYNSSGKVTGGLTDQLAAGGDQFMGFLRGEYDRVSPDGPEHFPVVYAKTLRMIATEPEIELASLTTVEAPTLVLQGDRDGDPRARRGGRDCARKARGAPGHPSPAGGEPGGGQRAAGVVPRRSPGQATRLLQTETTAWRSRR